MITLCAVGCTTTACVASSGTAEATSFTVVEENYLKDDDDQPFKDENIIDECDEISAVHYQMSCLCCFSLTVNLLVEACTMTISLRLAQRYIVAVPGITQHHYGSLIHISRTIAKVVQSKCGIIA